MLKKGEFPSSIIVISEKQRKLLKKYSNNLKASHTISYDIVQSCMKITYTF